MKDNEVLKLLKRIDGGYKPNQTECSHLLEVKELEWRALNRIPDSVGYLKNLNIQEGDIFLFFGNFHFITKKDGHIQYVKKTGDFYKDNDIQIIWGYMQIGEIITDHEKQHEFWWHPHADWSRDNDDANTIFKASEKLSFDKSKPGAGILPFDMKRVLTLEGAPKATWKKNPVYDTDSIIGNRKNSAKDPKNGIYYSGIWQELGLKETPECVLWAKDMIR